MNNTTVILSGETLFDVAVRNYGHLQGVAQMASDNGISLTGEIAPGDVVKVDESVSYDLPVVSIQKQTELAPNTYTVETWQNIFDVAIQKYGDLSGLVHLAADNEKGLTATLSPGEFVKIRNEVKNKLVVAFIKGAAIKVATGLSPEEEAEIKPEGIEYWAIEYDFIVS